jgi:hypothetical protein
MVQDVANAEGDKRRRVQVSERREVPWRRWRRSSAADMNEEEGVDDVGGRRGWIDLSTMYFLGADDMVVLQIIFLASMRVCEILLLGKNGGKQKSMKRFLRNSPLNIV